MAASAAKPGYGLTATWGGTATEEIISINGVGVGQMEPAEATFMGSDDRYKEFIFGLLNGPEITIQMNYRPKATGQQLLTTDAQAGTAKSLVVTLPGSLGVWTQTCLLTSWASDGITPGERMTGTATFKNSTGKPVLS